MKSVKQIKKAHDVIEKAILDNRKWSGHFDKPELLHSFRILQTLSWVLGKRGNIAPDRTVRALLLHLKGRI